MKKRCFVFAMAAVLLLGSVSTVSAAEVTTPEEPVREDRLFDYPVSAELIDFYGNVYGVNGYCTELSGGSGATTYFGISSYVSGSKPHERDALDALEKRVQVGGGTLYMDFSSSNFSTKSRTWNASGGDIGTSTTSSKWIIEIAGDHRVELSYCGAWWADISELSLY